MNIKNFFHKCLGFTLAEVLIALTLIGTVVLLTVPTMITNVQKHEYKSGVKKAHSLVSESFDSMKIDYDYIYKVYSNGNTDINNLRKTYTEYFGFQSNASGRYVGYSADHYNNLYHPLNNNNSSVNPAIYNGGGFNLRNNMTVLIGKVPAPGGSSALVISVDIDGPNKGLNQLGLDIFSFEIMPSDNILPMGAKGSETTSFDSTNYCVTPYSGNDLNGIACTFSAVHKAKYLDDVVTSDSHGCNGQLNGLGTWSGNTFTCFNQKEWNGACACVCKSGYTVNTYGFCENSTTKCVQVGDSGEKCPKGEHSIWDSNKNDYVCQEGYGLKDGVCTEGVCESDGYHFLRTSDNKCISCPDGLDGTDKCKCQDGYEWVTTQGQCMADCLTNLTGKTRNATSGECECSADKTKIGENCCIATKSIKVDGITYQISLKTDATNCEDYDCGQGTYKNGTCECAKSAAFDTSTKKCACDKTKHFTADTSGSSCTCEEGYELKGSSCVCANGSAADGCGCPADKGFVAGDSTNTCKCATSKGFKNKTVSKENANNGTVTCECSSSHAENQSGTCVCKGAHRLTENACNCAEHWVNASSGDDCVCDEKNGYFLVGDECKYFECRYGATPNLSTGACECNLANAQLSGNSCVCTISTQTVQTSTSGGYVCACPNNQILENNECVTKGTGGCAGPGQKKNNSTGGCECIPGTNMDENTTCKCDAGYEAFTATETKDSDYLKIGTYNSEYKDYQPMYCYNNACVSANGLWTSNGGTDGDCNCGSATAGIQWNGTACECQGTDAYMQGNDYTDRTCACGYMDGTKFEKVLKLSYDTTSKDCVAVGGTYQIDDEKDLKTLPHLGGAYNYKMTSDVSVEGNWTPIGSEDNPFKGTFDGGGKTVTIKSINLPEQDNVGFFGYTNTGCEIKNLNLVINGTITGKDFVGGLVGLNNCKIYNVTVTYETTGKITGQNNVGGLIGLNNGEVNPEPLQDTENSETRKATVISPKISGVSNLGGAIGNNNGVIYYTGVQSAQIDTANAPTSVGGFVGFNVSEGQIDKSYVNSTTVINNQTDTKTILGQIIGGFVGINNGNISNSYTQALVKGNSTVGGFAGNINSGTITNVYTMPTEISAVSISGGFAGTYTAGKIENSLYSTKNITKPDSEEETLAGVTGKTDAQLKTPSTYLCIDGWLTDSGTKFDPQIWYFPYTTTDGTTTYQAPQLLPADNTNTCNSVNEYIVQTGTEMGCLAMYTNDSCETTTTCGVNEHYDVNNSKCVAACTNGVSTWIEIDDKKNKVYACKCAGDLVELEGEGTCQCPTGSILYGESTCIKCSDYEAEVSGDTCICKNKEYYFDIDLKMCYPKDCTDKTGIWDKDAKTCTKLPTPLVWNSETNKANCNTDEEATSFSLSTDSDLFYMSECTYNDGKYIPNNEKYIPKGTIDWTSGKTFTLTSNIDMTNYSYGKPQEFRPIRDFQGSSFTGGASTKYTISNLIINLPETDNVGLFASVTGQNSKVTNLTLSDFNITGQDNVGSLIGIYNCNRTKTAVTIQSINISGATIKGEQNIGGVIGKTTKINANKNATLNKIQFVGNINSDEVNSYKGGIIGWLDFQNNDTQYFAMNSTYANPTFQCGTSTCTNCGGSIGRTTDTYFTDPTGKINQNNYYTVSNDSPVKSWLGTEECISTTYQTLFQRCESVDTSTTTYSCSTYPSGEYPSCTHKCDVSCLPSSS